MSCLRIAGDLESKLFDEFKKAMNEEGYDFPDSEIIKKVKNDAHYYKLVNGELSFKSQQEFESN